MFHIFFGCPTAPVPIISPLSLWIPLKELAQQSRPCHPRIFGSWLFVVVFFMQNIYEDCPKKIFTTDFRHQLKTGSPVACHNSITDIFRGYINIESRVIMLCCALGCTGLRDALGTDGCDFLDRRWWRGNWAKIVSPSPPFGCQAGLFYRPWPPNPRKGQGPAYFSHSPSPSLDKGVVPWSMRGGLANGFFSSQQPISGAGGWTSPGVVEKGPGVEHWGVVGPLPHNVIDIMMYSVPLFAVQC